MVGQSKWMAELDWHPVTRHLTETIHRGHHAVGRQLLRATLVGNSISQELISPLVLR